MESVNCVCEEALEEHESPLNIYLKEEEVQAELDYEIDLLCLVQEGISLVYCSLKIKCKAAR